VNSGPDICLPVSICFSDVFSPPDSNVETGLRDSASSSQTKQADLHGNIAIKLSCIREQFALHNVPNVQ
jgi:hypothetical protein